MSEWSIVHPWKGCVLAIEPGVRISPCPPINGAPYEFRTRVSALRTQRPRPLDEGGKYNNYFNFFLLEVKFKNINLIFYY